ncbi:hypothetical protein F1735_23495 [Massilia sp. CCM 8694]|uniref:Uncharacterized protein n=1 Tax=Massilia genomosp. 1 TaxID=2609280 RepID=A0ABX0MZY7_9BURK|nr:hypothetical protein [Massilia genomosp. 1]
MDKSGFINRINRLRIEKVAGKGLYLRRMTVGQKFACEQSRWFCTSHPVDIHRLIHMCCQPVAFFATFFGLEKSDLPVFVAGCFFWETLSFCSAKKKIFRFLAFGVLGLVFSKVLMVYLKRLNIELVVVVNRGVFLWIMAKTCTKS